MIREYLRKFFAKSIYPTYRGDWYKRKGYKGITHQKKFADFVQKQQTPEGVYFKEFKNLQLTRRFIPCGKHVIDTVFLKPDSKIGQDKLGGDLVIVCFQGRGEYYESRFRDMALMAQNTGATVIGFNPKGFHSSTGKTRILKDIVEDGIVIVSYLLAKNIKSAQIIFYGNSLGGGVQEMVNQHFLVKNNYRFRQINSNSFRSLGSVFACRFKVPFLERIISKIMDYAGWEIRPGADFFHSGIYRCYLDRLNDGTILPKARYSSLVNPQADLAQAPEEFRETLRWLQQNHVIVCLENKQGDPHNFSLNNFCLNIKDQNGSCLSVWEFINKYLEATNALVGLRNQP